MCNEVRSTLNQTLSLSHYGLPLARSIASSAKSESLIPHHFELFFHRFASMWRREFVFFVNYENRTDIYPPGPIMC